MAPWEWERFLSMIEDPKHFDLTDKDVEALKWVKEQIAAAERRAEEAEGHAKQWEIAATNLLSRSEEAEAIAHTAEMARDAHYAQKLEAVQSLSSMLSRAETAERNVSVANRLREEAERVAKDNINWFNAMKDRAEEAERTVSALCAELSSVSGAIMDANTGIAVGDNGHQYAENIRELTRLREEAEREVAFYKEREAHFSKVLRVADNGQYRADWDGAIRRVLDEKAEAERKVALLREVAEEAQEAIGLEDGDPMKPVAQYDPGWRDADGWPSRLQAAFRAAREGGAL